MNNEIKNDMNDTELNNVAGGNKGDTQIEINKHRPSYKVGDVVEVYKTFLHWHTSRATITEVHTNGAYPLYTVKYESGKIEGDLMADDFESSPDFWRRDPED